MASWTQENSHVAELLPSSSTLWVDTFMPHTEWHLVATYCQSSFIFKCSSSLRQNEPRQPIILFISLHKPIHSEPLLAMHMYVWVWHLLLAVTAGTELSTVYHTYHIISNFRKRNYFIIRNAGSAVTFIIIKWILKRCKRAQLKFCEWLIWTAQLFATYSKTARKDDFSVSLVSCVGEHMVLTGSGELQMIQIRASLLE